MKTETFNGGAFISWPVLDFSPSIFQLSEERPDLFSEFGFVHQAHPVVKLGRVFQTLNLMITESFNHSLRQNGQEHQEEFRSIDNARKTRCC